MFKSRHYLIKVLYVVGVFTFFVSCDEDYVNSLTGTASPKVFLEVINDLDDAYLGESIDNLQLALQIENSPAISFLSFSIDFDSDFFQANDIIVAPSQDNLFYNLNSDAIIESITDTTLSSFEVSIGFTNNIQDSTYTYGDGKIADLFLSGINAQTKFDISLDQIISYQDFDIDLNEWQIDSPVIIGPEIPSLIFNDLSYEDGIVKVTLYGNNLPLLTQSDIIINYNSDIFNFSSINELNPSAVDLLQIGYDLELTETQPGVVQFDFNHSDGNEDFFIEEDGGLVELSFILEFGNIDFESETSPLYLDLNSIFSQATFDICGNCGIEATYDEFWPYDVSYWNVLNQQIEIHFGCMDSEALNYDSNAIINIEENCIYE